MHGRRVLGLSSDAPARCIRPAADFHRRSGRRPLSRPRILIVDDEVATLDTLRILLKGEGFEVSTASSGQQGLEAITDAPPDVVLSDIRMQGISGIEVLSAIRKQGAMIPVVLMTAQASLQSAIQAVNQGAFHYIQKPFSNDELVTVCHRAVESRLGKRPLQGSRTVGRRWDAGQFKRPVGRSRAFKEILGLAETVAPTDSTVLISGESGTGKEVLARYLHNLSKRAGGPFVSINCGALPENLLESELFGHLKGAFTGAIRDKEGLFVAAGSGTFFLDEVGEMTPATQVKLLRVLQEREVVPVGATEPIRVDARIVAATNRDLEEEIRRGAFRSDLYYRLNVITLHLPPLRDRVDDVPVLAEYLLSSFAAVRGDDVPRLTPEASELLKSYDWPGNVRELENALERAAVLSKDSVIAPDALPLRLRSRPVRSFISEKRPPNPTLETVERAYILWVLDAVGGNKTRAAQVLGIDPSTLYRKLVRYGIQQ
ncbi:MAG: response regulator [Gemmatimonas sp.]|nr:response regulator [Gemmatimonas sp.]